MDVGFDFFPADNKADSNAYKTAIDTLSPGDAITILTPDSTHYPIALYAIERKIHVLVRQAS
jgi:D-galacturonate reductase